MTIESKKVSPVVQPRLAKLVERYAELGFNVWVLSAEKSRLARSKLENWVQGPLPDETLGHWLPDHTYALVEWRPGQQTIFITGLGSLAEALPTIRLSQSDSVCVQEYLPLLVINLETGSLFEPVPTYALHDEIEEATLADIAAWDGFGPSSGYRKVC